MKTFYAGEARFFLLLGKVTSEDEENTLVHFYPLKKK